MAQVIAILNPITHERVSTDLPAGKPLRDYMKIPEGVLIERNGLSYDNEPLKEDDLITMIVVPQGGEQGKDIARTGIVIAAMIGAGALAGPLGLGAVGKALLVGAVSFGANMLATPLIPPKEIR